MKRAMADYLRKERKWMGLYLACVGIYCIVLFLYNTNLDGVSYAALLTLCLLAGAMVAGGIRYVRHYGEVQGALAAVPYEVGEFPGAETMTEALYQEKLIAQCRYAEELESGMRIGRQDMMDYYGLWVHQIKTPIAAMRLLIQNRENEESAAADPEEAQFLRSLKMELFKTEQYVEMVLSYLRMEEMSADLVLRRYSLDSIVRQAVKKYSSLFIMKKIRLEYRECDAQVLTDEKWLLFVLEQLLSNALKYTREGSITIFCDEESGELVIRDTGIGIQEEDLPRIFEKGFTGYNGRLDKKSTGIGLYLCKQICDKLNHRITVTSVEGRGTDVRLELEREERTQD